MKRRMEPVPSKYYNTRSTKKKSNEWMDISSSSVSGCSGNAQSSLGQNRSIPQAGNSDQVVTITNAVLNSIKKTQTELLDNFKKETDDIVKDFKSYFNDLKWEVNSMYSSVSQHRNEMGKINEQLEELEERIEDMMPESQSNGNSDTSSTESEEREDILQEIELIKESDQTFMDYRPLTGQYWEVDQPVVFQVCICNTILDAIYDPRVAKSVVSGDLIPEDYETDDLEYDKVFYVPWWFPKLQICNVESRVNVIINKSHSHSLNVSLIPGWNRTVVLGFNFGQKFVYKVDENSRTITFIDDSNTQHSLPFDYYN